MKYLLQCACVALLCMMAVSCNKADRKVYRPVMGVESLFTESMADTVRIYEQRYEQPEPQCVLSLYRRKGNYYIDNGPLPDVLAMSTTIFYDTLYNDTGRRVRLRYNRVTNEKIGNSLFKCTVYCGVAAQNVLLVLFYDREYHIRSMRYMVVYDTFKPAGKKPEAYDWE